MKVKIEKGGKRGAVTYDPESKNLAILFDGPYAAVEKHLTAPRISMIPKSSRIDDLITIKARPTESIDHMKLALCTLEQETGFRVDWETFKEA